MPRDPRTTASLKRDEVIAVLVKHVRQGKAPAPHCRAAVPALCPRCGTFAILPLDDATKAAQPDETVYVCHPALDGCNVGFALIETAGLPVEAK